MRLNSKVDTIAWKDELGGDREEEGEGNKDGGDEEAKGGREEGGVTVAAASRTRRSGNKDFGDLGRWSN